MQKENGCYLIIIDNQLLDEKPRDGLFLNMEKLVQQDEAGNYTAVTQHSTATAFLAAEDFVFRMADNRLCKDEIIPIGEQLNSGLFYFIRNESGIPVKDRYRISKINALMPQIITTPWPAVALAVVNIQIEFERTVSSIVNAKKPDGKNLIYMAGIHQRGVNESHQIFPPILFIPWAAYVQQRNGEEFILEQRDLVTKLRQCSIINPDEINLEKTLKKMERPPLRIIDR